MVNDRDAEKDVNVNDEAFDKADVGLLLGPIANPFSCEDAALQVCLSVLRSVSGWSQVSLSSLSQL